MVFHLKNRNIHIKGISVSPSHLPSRQVLAFLTFSTLEGEHFSNKSECDGPTVFNQASLRLRRVLLLG